MYICLISQSVQNYLPLQIRLIQHECVVMWSIANESATHLKGATVLFIDGRPTSAYSLQVTVDFPK